MRKFVDLHLCPSLNDLKQIRLMAENSKALGYSLISVPVSPRNSRETVRLMQNVCKEVGLDFASRIDLKPNSPKELLTYLRRLRRRFEVLCVICNSKAVARQAAKDKRVDLLSFPSTNPRERFFDSAEAELASQALASLEIDMSTLLVAEGFQRIRLLSSLRREVMIAKKFHLPIVISSGAKNEYLMRKPLEYAALATLFDLEQSSALDALSTNPSNIVKRNREKLSQSFVAPGVRIVRRGRNCQKP